MPNTLTAIGMSQLASAMVAGLWDSATLINTVYRDAETDIAVGRGDTITIRSPQVIAAQNFAGTAVVTDIVEGKIDVKMDLQPYSQVQLSAKEETLGIVDLAATVVAPQVGGIVEFLEAAVAGALEGTGGTATGASWREAVAAAFGVLGANKVPLAGRTLAVAPDVAGSLLTDVVFVSADSRADNGAAINDATLGRLHGFDVVVSPALSAGTAVAYHSTAVAAAFRNPVSPQGAVSGTASYNGYTAQTIYAYSPTALADLITVQTLAGVAGASDIDKRAVKVAVGGAPFKASK